jgi:hypothetical protein
MVAGSGRISYRVMFGGGEEGANFVRERAVVRPAMPPPRIIMSIVLLAGAMVVSYFSKVEVSILKCCDDLRSGVRVVEEPSMEVDRWIRKFKRAKQMLGVQEILFSSCCTSDTFNAFRSGV